MEISHSRPEAGTFSDEACFDFSISSGLVHVDLCDKDRNPHVPLQEGKKISRFQSRERDIICATATHFCHNYNLGAHTTQYKSLSTVVTKV